MAVRARHQPAIRRHHPHRTLALVAGRSARPSEIPTPVTLRPVEIVRRDYQPSKAELAEDMRSRSKI